MSASAETAETPEPSNDVERLIRDLFASEHMVCTIAAGDNLAVAELIGKNTPYFGRGWWKVETPGWHIHARVDAIKGVRFVREPSDHFAGQDSLSIRLLGPNGESLLRAYFTKLYDEQNQPIAERFARWEQLKARYGAGQDEAAVVDGNISAVAGRRAA